MEKTDVILEDYFYYDENSPSFLRWSIDIWCGNNNSIHKIHIGDVAGTLGKLKDGSVRYRVTLRIGRQKFTYEASRIVWMLHHGAISKGLLVDHVDGNSTNNRISNLRLVTREVNNRNSKMHKSNSTGVNGVSYYVNVTDGREYPYFAAYVRLLTGRRKLKTFSVKKLGHEEAFRLACEWREEMIQSLNQQGAGYTERHGT
jgi:hypothetical protein